MHFLPHLVVIKGIEIHVCQHDEVVELLSRLLEENVGPLRKCGLEGGRFLKIFKDHLSDDVDIVAVFSRPKDTFKAVEELHGEDFLGESSKRLFLKLVIHLKNLQGLTSLSKRLRLRKTFGQQLMTYVCMTLRCTVQSTSSASTSCSLRILAK